MLLTRPAALNRLTGLIPFGLPLDPIGPAPLKFYRPNEQVERRGPRLWGRAHVTNTTDPALYQRVGERYFSLGARAAG